MSARPEPRKPLAPEAIEKLAKLVPMLSSDRDGEVVAAARMIGKALKASGNDIHDLTAALVGRRTGWLPGRLRQTSGTTCTFSYADTFKESTPLYDGPEPADALTRRFGLPVHSADRIDSWPTVARHCLRLDRSVPKKHGGKFLEDWQKAMLKTFVDDLRVPTNRQVEWIERTVARLHQARDAAARAAP